MSREFINQKILYQMGDGRGNHFIFPKTELAVSSSSSIKTMFDDNSGINGLINNSLSEEFKKGAYEFTIDFMLDNKDYIGLDYVKSFFWNGYKTIAFFYDLDKNGFINFYYTYLTITNSFLENYSSQIDYANDKIKVQVSVTAENPFFYETFGLQYFNENTYTPSLWDGSRTLDGSWNLDIGETSSIFNFANLSNDLKKQYFYDECGENAKPLIFVDRFFKIENMAISSNLLVNQTLTTNALLDTTTNNLLIGSTAKNPIYLIEIGSLNQNETLSIQNLSNNSGLKFTWLSSATSGVIYYNSFKNRCYNSNKEIISERDIRIEILNNKFLFFNPQKNMNKLSTVNNDNLRIQKNTSSNLTLKIETLKTFN